MDIVLNEPINFHWVLFNSSPPSAEVNRVSIGSDNGLSPIECQAMIYTNAGSWWNLNRNIKLFIHKMHLKMSSVKWQMAAILMGGGGGGELM